MKNDTKRAVIITSYIESTFDMKSFISADDFVICTDGGYDIAVNEGIRPDLLIGDFDSIKATLPCDIEIERFNPEKDFTDLELALKSAVKSNIKNVEIWGGIGGRLDHTIANIQLLSNYTNCFDSLIMKDGSNSCFAIHSEGNLVHIDIPSKDNCYFSVFSLTEKCHGLSIEGVKYPLFNHTLTNSFPLGVSNEFTEKKVHLSLKKGTLLVVISSQF